MFKKILLVLSLVCGILLGSALITPAESLYLDTMINGSMESPQGDGDAQETYIGFEYPIDKFKLNGELLFGSWDGNDNDFNGYELKGGYRIYQDQNNQLYLTVAGYNRELDDTNQTITGILIGADGVIALSQKLSAEGSIGYSLNGEIEDNDANLLNLKLKLNYLLTNDLSAAVGYRYYGCDPKHGGDYNSSGLTLGIDFKF